MRRTPLFLLLGSQLGVAGALRLPPAIGGSQLRAAAALRLPPATGSRGSEPRSDVVRRLKQRYTGAADASLQSLVDSAANATGGCNLCENRWVFILSPGGRTGSTTVMDMLNAANGFYIAGENGGVMGDLLDMYQGIVDHRLKSFHKDSGQSLHSFERGVFCAVQSFTRELIGAAPPGTHTIGFKEIRWGESPELLAFMLKAFPCARFVVNTRSNIGQQVRSIRGLWGKSADRETLRKRADLLRAWQSEHADKARLLPVERFSVQAFNDLLHWFDVRGCWFTSVCHSNAQNGYKSSRKQHVAGHCRLQEKPG